jgi:hypothetical protein
MSSGNYGSFCDDRLSLTCFTFRFLKRPLSPSAVVERGLSAADRDAERRDTAFGAVLTRLLTAAVLVTMAERRTPGMGRCMTSDRSPTRFMRCWAGRSLYGRARRHDGGGARVVPRPRVGLR